jgi:1-deoxy-D-xylulose-5-phosphate reductoisomerase
VDNSQVESDTRDTSRCRDVILLGSTGSIGTQAADIIGRNPDRFRLAGIAAGGGNPGLLARQAVGLGAEVVAVANAAAVPDLRAALAAVGSAGQDRRKLPEVIAGADAVAELAGRPCDVVLNAVTGAVGLSATLAALQAGRVLALANKESLIMGGPLVAGIAAAGQIVPVDSEHSAIAQCLRGGSSGEVQRLVLTASGGPFLHRSRTELADVTPEQALAHPTWNMGPVITVNSATLVNKGLELIEAHLLFGVGFDRIEVVVHRQSVIHSMVEFTDGSTLAQASPPDMRIPIALALGWPDRVPGAAAAVDWTAAHAWTFEPLDEEAFPAVPLARHAGAAGGTVPAVYNAANEECVDAFLAGQIPFAAIVDTVAQVVSEHHDSAGDAAKLADVLAADSWARDRARELTGKQ